MLKRESFVYIYILQPLPIVGFMIMKEGDWG